MVFSGKNFRNGSVVIIIWENLKGNIPKSGVLAASQLAGVQPLAKL